MGYDYIRKKPEDKTKILSKYTYRKFSMLLENGILYSYCQINNLQNKPCASLNEVMQVYTNPDSFYLIGKYNNGKDFILLKKYIVGFEDESTKDVVEDDEND